MRKYRIIKETFGPDETDQWFYLQYKFLFWWFNYKNSYGVLRRYYSEERAKQDCAILNFKTKYEVIENK